MVAYTPAIGGSRQWAGKLFLLVATLWFAGVFWVLRPDQPHVDPRPTPIVTLPDGTTHVVYLPYEILGAEAGWVEKIDVKTQYTYWEFMRRPLIRFLVLAMGPPAALLFGSFAWLGIVEWRHRRRHDYSY